MRLSADEHLRHPWRIHALVNDFELLDVWCFPLVADPVRGETFEMVCQHFLKVLQSPDSFRGATGLLFRLRSIMGRIGGWDDAVNVWPIPGCTETSLRERLSDGELAEQAEVHVYDTAVFAPVYATANERFYETANATVHAGLHLGWLPETEGRFVVQMAVYAKPRGTMGRAYMALIAPFRHWIVYPAMMRWVERSWPQRKPLATPAN